MCENQWLSLESNPEVMTKFGRALGLPEGVKFCDVWNLDLLDRIPSPRYAILLLFPLTQRTLRAIDILPTTILSSSTTLASITSYPFFCKQAIPDACATIAVLHAALNSGLPITPDSFLHRFFHSTASFSPNDRGRALQADRYLDRIHQQFAEVSPKLPSATPNQTNHSNKLPQIPTQPTC